MNRRAFLSTAAVLGGSGLTGCMGLTAPQNTGDVDSGSPLTTRSPIPSIEEWTSQMNNYDGVIDHTETDSVTVDVGAKAANGTYFAFGPAAVAVSPGTTVTWRWLGNGGSHNVRAVDGADFSSETTATEGHTFERTFESERTVMYQCDPHTSIGMKGVVLVRESNSRSTTRHS